MSLTVGSGNTLLRKQLGCYSSVKSLLSPEFMQLAGKDKVISWLAKTNTNRQFGIVALVPSFNKRTQYENLGCRVANTNDIFNVVKALKDGSYEQTAVFANRYDGIDLPDNACRILIIDSKPYFDSLLDRYEEDCRSNSDIMNVRIAQKVEQGLGRSVRGEKDYSIIVLVGGDLVKFIKSPLSNKYFSAQTRKQIDIGMQVATFAKEEAEDEEPLKILTKLMEQALRRDDGWKAYYSEEMDSISSDETRQNIYDTLRIEYEAERQFMLGEYDKACELMQKLCDRFDVNDTEKGWYLQQLARYRYRTSKVKANQTQKSAFQNNLQLLKPRDGISYKKIESINLNRVKRIKEWIGPYSGYEDMMISLEGFLQNLTFGMPSEKFEAALEEVGKAIGFLSQRPDKEIKKGPDNLWCGIEDQYVLLECKNEVELTRAEIIKQEAGQMNSHSAWFESEYGDAKCKRILIIPTKKLSYHGDFTHEVEIMRKNKLQLLKTNIKNFYKEFATYVWDDVSDEKIQQLLDVHKLDITSIITLYSEPYKKGVKQN